MLWLQTPIASWFGTFAVVSQWLLCRFSLRTPGWVGGNTQARKKGNAMSQSKGRQLLITGAPPVSFSLALGLNKPRQRAGNGDRVVSVDNQSCIVKSAANARVTAQTASLTSMLIYLYNFRHLGALCSLCIPVCKYLCKSLCCSCSTCRLNVSRILLLPL